MAKKKKLTKAEHLEMELNSEQLSNLKLQKELKVQQKQIQLLKIKITELESQKIMKNIDGIIDIFNARINKIQEDNKEFNNKIKNKYKIKGNFGINPDSGEIEED